MISITPFSPGKITLRASRSFRRRGSQRYFTG
jgi:hypothetical protein